MNAQSTPILISENWYFPLQFEKEILSTSPPFNEICLSGMTPNLLQMLTGPVGGDKGYITDTNNREEDSEHAQGARFPLVVLTKSNSKQ